MRFGLAAIQNYQRILEAADQKELLDEVNQLYQTYSSLYQGGN